MKTIIDLFNMLHVSFSIAKTQVDKESGIRGSFSEENVGLYYHKVLDSVINLTKTHGQLIFANEGRGSLDWRRSIYPGYKGNRKKDDTYQIFKNHLNDVMGLISCFPSKIISVDGAEADDVMYSLATYFADEGEDVTVITSDRDMAQLLNYSDRIHVYSPVTKSFREKQANLILEKAIVGDPSDNIPGIPRIGEKTFLKALNDKSVWDAKIAPNQELVDNFVKIVDLSKAPAYIKDEAIVKYNSTEFSEFDPQAVEMFMFNNGLNSHIDKWKFNRDDINIKLYEQNLNEVAPKKVEAAAIEEVDEILNLINNL